MLGNHVLLVLLFGDIEKNCKKVAGARSFRPLARQQSEKLLNPETFAGYDCIKVVGQPDQPPPAYFLLYCWLKVSFSNKTVKSSAFSEELPVTLLCPVTSSEVCTFPISNSKNWQKRCLRFRSCSR